jgi:hypothetical protein
LLFDGSKNGGVFVGHEATFPNRHWVTAGAFPILPTHWMPQPAGPNGLFRGNQQHDQA